MNPSLFLKQFPVDHVWLFVTERCQLQCSHCFFKFKADRAAMPGRVIRAVFDFLPGGARHQFILSGGEPLLAWPCVRRIVSSVRREYAASYLSLQSNGILLDGVKTSFLRENGVNVELGIDGDRKSVLKNRKGMSADSYGRMCRGLKALKQSGVPVSTTMTVRPYDAGRLFDNLVHLDQLGAAAIEIHPAFGEAWSAGAAALFLKEYRRAGVYALRERKAGFISREYSAPSRGIWDLVVLPDGRVLPNWTLLSFPEYVREKFYVMGFSGGKGVVSPAAAGYFNILKKFLISRRGVVSYRQLSNFNASLAVRHCRGRRWAARLGPYVRLCEQIEAHDQEFLRRQACVKSVMNAR